MAVHRGSVLTDTNTVIEAHRVGAWRALSSRYRLVTVAKCLEETQTGFQRRRPEENIDPTVLRPSFHSVEPDDALAIMRLQLDGPGAHLDAGELSLWTHALTREDDWLICGADAASMRFGFDQGHRARLVSLGGLLNDIGFRPALPLRRNFGKPWLDDLIHRLAMEGLRPGPGQGKPA
ncbi:hypothetical protein LPC10_17615 [Methylorubrum sp. B1-46]|uniref:hypothetical protein n=1 Tax=Methylorubrum TaxID=2282523 RepID=UPI001E2FD062|nr:MULTISPECIES: hypothetical protein [Methylorubrum]MCG5246888.1 hypothetical protein [Methylorubrum extorquens]UGB24750.1 hypothetical protein LPC10_17615 [Methylorubrum sp. B1-46]